MASAMTEWRHKNPERAKQAQREYERKNRDKINANRKAWRKANPGKMRDQWLQQQYGVGTAWYNIVLAAQNHRCAICKRHESEFKRALAVDHNHTTHRNRGLLCTACNVLLGMIEKAQVRWVDLQEYLAKYA